MQCETGSMTPLGELVHAAVWNFRFVPAERDLAYLFLD